MSKQHLLTYLRTLKTSSLARNIPNISEQNAEFIKEILRTRKLRHLLEIGTANGYSALQFSIAIPEGDITTIEYAWNAHNEAVEHFKNCKVKNIHAIWGDAKMVLPTLRSGYFDCIYIDAMKREYLRYLELSLTLATEDAIIIIDDVVKFRDKMSDFYEWLYIHKIPYTIEMTDEDDGIMILYKKDISSYE
jgi:predicted O-methyltransferase YrrM